MINKDPDYTDDDLAAVSDNPEWTAEDFARSQPFHVRFPHLAASLYGDGLSGTHEAYLPVAIERDLVERFMAGGLGWEARLNETLRKAVESAA